MKPFKKKIHLSRSIFICGFVCILITLLIFFAKAIDSQKDLQRLFTKVSEQQISAFKENLQYILNYAASMRLFYESSSYVSWDEYETFVNPIIRQNNSLKALVWIPRVMGDERNEYEVKIRSYGLEDFIIFTLDKHCQVQREKTQPVYYPVYYFLRYLSEEGFIGLNLGSFDEKMDQFDLILTEGRPIVSPVLQINSRRIEPGTHCIYIPVYIPHQVICTPEGRRKNLQGFIGIYLDFNQFLAEIESNSAHDVTLKYSVEQIVHRPSEHQDKLVTNHRIRNVLNSSDFYYHCSLPIADKYICLNIKPGSQFIKENKSVSHWFILPVLLIVSGLIVLYLYSLQNRRQQAEELVQERTQQLRQQKEKADLLATQAIAANRAKSEFLSNMSHEMRTPLNSIIGYSDILGSEQIDEEHRTYVDSILTSAEHLLELINNILNLSRIESGKIEIQKTECNVTELINKICKVMCPLATEKSIELNVNLENNLPESLTLNGKYLDQCVINLVANAIKFTEEGTVSLTIKLINTDSRPQILVEVADTGIGIPVDKQQAIFDSFTQVDNSSTRQHQGSGLGLTITKRFVELMGGEITLESEIEKGSTFTIVLPVELRKTVMMAAD